MPFDDINSRIADSYCFQYCKKEYINEFSRDFIPNYKWF